MHVVKLTYLCRNIRKVIHSTLNQFGTFMALNKILVLIPARYDSSRFPGKPLAKILGKPMVQRVYEQIASGPYQGCELDAFVVTDSEKIKKAVNDFGGNVCLISDNTESGTERIALALERFFKNKKYDLIINVQGDEPLIRASIIENLVKYHLSSTFDIATVVRKDNDIGDNPNVVKAIYSKPSADVFIFPGQKYLIIEILCEKVCMLMLVFYSFRPLALTSFCRFSPSEYERVESLEQLRALENGLTIGAIEVNEHLQGVDTPDDIAKVEEQLNE